MAYIRKTVDEYELQGWYGYGWETLLSEDSKQEAYAQKRCYDENEPSVPHRVKKVRVPKTGGQIVCRVR